MWHGVEEVIIGGHGDVQLLWDSWLWQWPCDSAPGSWRSNFPIPCLVLNDRKDTSCVSGWRSFLKTQLRVYIQSAKTRPGADCGSDHELLIAKFRLKLKKIGKTTRPFRYDLHQIPYDYTVEVRNRFKGLDLIDRVPDELWREVPDIV